MGRRERGIYVTSWKSRSGKLAGERDSDLSERKKVACARLPVAEKIFGDRETRGDRSTSWNRVLQKKKRRKKRDFLRLTANNGSHPSEPRIVAGAGALAPITTQANNGQMLPGAYKTPRTRDSVVGQFKSFCCCKNRAVREREKKRAKELEKKNVNRKGWNFLAGIITLDQQYSCLGNTAVPG